jgi:hypothetical protein
MEQCRATRRDGQRCTGRALPNELVCFAHSPSVEEIRRRGAQGGTNRRTAIRAARLGPGALAGVQQALFETLEGLQKGSVEPKQGTAIAVVAATLIKCREACVLELRLAETLRRLDAIERGRPA